MAPKVCFLGAVRHRTMICCRNVKISASSAARDRNRSTTAQTMSLKRSLITDQHRPILGQPPAIRFATGTAAVLLQRSALMRSGARSLNTSCPIAAWSATYTARRSSGNQPVCRRSRWSAMMSKSLLALCADMERMPPAASERWSTPRTRLPPSPPLLSTLHAGTANGRFPRKETNARLTMPGSAVGVAGDPSGPKGLRGHWRSPAREYRKPLWRPSQPTRDGRPRRLDRGVWSGFCRDMFEGA